MEKLICCLLTAGSLLLFPEGSPAQTHNTTYPQKKYSQMNCAKSVEDAVTLLRSMHQSNETTSLSDQFHYNVRQWTQRDISEFARCAETYDFFETLLGVGNDAVEKDATGNYTPQALKAQQALTYLKPDVCKSWKGFCGMIANAADESQAVRDRYHKLGKK